MILRFENLRKKRERKYFENNQVMQGRIGIFSIFTKSSLYPTIFHSTLLQDLYGLHKVPSLLSDFQVDSVINKYQQETLVRQCDLH